MKFIIEMNETEIRDCIENGSLTAMLKGLEVHTKKTEGEPKTVMPPSSVSAEPDILQPVPKETEVIKPAMPTAQVEPPAPASAAVEPQVPSVPVTPVETSTVSYTADDLAMASMELIRQGMSNQALQDVLKQFGVQALPQLSPDQYGAYATAIRALGAKI